MMKRILLSLFLIPTLAFGQALPKITLDQEKFLTDRKGALQIKNILDLNVGDSVSIFTQDGLQAKGKVFQREEEQGKSIKIYGQLNEDEKSGFGFIFSKEEGLSGALVVKKTDTNYILLHNNVDNSFYFIKIIKVSKTIKL